MKIINEMWLKIYTEYREAFCKVQSWHEHGHGHFSLCECLKPIRFHGTAIFVCSVIRVTGIEFESISHI